MRYVIASLALFVLLAGCKSGDNNKTVRGDDSSILKDVPEWYASPPVNEDTIYATGTALSADIFNAKMEARSVALDRMSQSTGLDRADLSRLSNDDIQEKFIMVRQRGKVRAYVLLGVAADLFGLR